MLNLCVNIFDIFRGIKMEGLRMVKIAVLDDEPIFLERISK